MESLIRQFGKAGLTLKSWKRRDEIFAMDIKDKAFLMQTGGEGNDVHVQNADPDMKQLVLMVHEKRRSFDVSIPKSMKQPEDVIVRELNARSILVRRFSPDVKRHFLVGLDEMDHPFITALSQPAVTVRAAHESLKPPELRGKKVRGRGKNYRAGQSEDDIARQGEWFFVETSETVRQFLESKKAMIRRKVAVGTAWNNQRGGNPHMADETLAIPAAGKQARRVYVRGKVRHAEHKTLEFFDWMQVLRNTEANARAAGVNWVD